MPQTPSFFNQRGLSLYNRLVGQRLSLRSGAASATQPVGQLNEPMVQTGHPSNLSDIGMILRANTFATIGMILSVTMWLVGMRQIGLLTAVAPGTALCCGLFGLVYSGWIAIRDSRPLIFLFCVWAVVPLLWTAYFLLVLHPSTLGR